MGTERSCISCLVLIIRKKEVFIFQNCLQRVFKHPVYSTADFFLAFACPDGAIWAMLVVSLKKASDVLTWCSESQTCWPQQPQSCCQTVPPCSVHVAEAVPLLPHEVPLFRMQFTALGTLGCSLSPRVSQCLLQEFMAQLKWCLGTWVVFLQLHDPGMPGAAGVTTHVHLCSDPPLLQEALVPKAR